jgi:hypothetical protein
MFSLKRRLKVVFVGLVFPKEMIMSLLRHIEMLNAKADQMMAEEPGLWMSKYTDDLAHWAEMGVHTVEDFKRNELINGISDASKDLYGCRLRLNWDEMSIEDMEATYDNICKQLREQFEMEKEAEAFEAELKKGLSLDCEPLPYEEFVYLENV